MTPGQRNVPLRTGWRIVLPPGWITLPTDPNRRDASIRAFVDSQMQGKARDELIAQRIELERRLREDVARAALTGVTHIHSLADLVSGAPVTATLIVADMVVGTHADLAQELAAITGPDEGTVAVSHVDVAGAMAVRRQRRVLAPLGDDPTAPELWQTQVEYLVEAAADRILVLMFSTVTDPLAPELVVLFDAIAATLHRDDDGGELSW
jgi:hypothetical protein